MKTFIFVLMISLLSLDAKTGKASSNCTLNGKPLYGFIQIVDTGEDVKIQNVTTAPDLKIEVVKSGPSRCGQWLFVNTGANLKVRFVNTGADLHIQFVTTGPGLN